MDSDLLIGNRWALIKKFRVTVRNSKSDLCVILIHVRKNYADIISREYAFTLFTNFGANHLAAAPQKSGRALLSIIGYRQSKLLYRSKALLY